MALVRYGLIALASAVLLYAATLAASVVAFERAGVTRDLDVSSPATDIIFGTSGLSAVVYNRLPLARPGPRLILIGASNMHKVPASKIAAGLGGIEVHNISVDGSSPRDWNRLLDLAYEMIPSRSRSQTTFVAGVAYVTFLDDRPLDTDSIDSELLRFGIYRRNSEGRVVLGIPSETLPVALIGVRPFILSIRCWETFLFASANAATAMLSGLGNAGSFDEFAQDNVVVDEAARRTQLLAMRNSQPHVVMDAAFASLTRLAERVSAAGGRFVIVDLPLPSWHARGVNAFADYQRRKWTFYGAMLRIRDVSYINLQQGFPDDGFYDSIHPKPKAAEEWAIRMAVGLRSQLESRAPRSQSNLTQ